jgi:hypothetical protein
LIVFANPSVYDFDMDQVATKRRRSIKAPGLKAAVVIARANGRDKRKIARDLGIARMTVDTILAEASLDQQIESGRIGCANLITKSIKVIDERLDKGSETAAFGILNPLVLRNESLAPTKRMTGDVTLNQTLQVLLRSDSSNNAKELVVDASVTDNNTK